jgi:chromosome segregation ATPase
LSRLKDKMSNYQTLTEYENTHSLYGASSTGLIYSLMEQNKEFSKKFDKITKDLVELCKEVKNGNSVLAESINTHFTNLEKKVTSLNQKTTENSNDIDSRIKTLTDNLTTFGDKIDEKLNEIKKYTETIDTFIKKFDKADGHKSEVTNSIKNAETTENLGYAGISAENVRLSNPFTGSSTNFKDSSKFPIENTSKSIIINKVEHEGKKETSITINY